MKTKLFTLLLAVAASVGTMFASVTINGIAYELNGTTATVVSGGNYTGTIVIPASVTYDSKTYTVTSIGQGAFRYCTGLTSVRIGNRVTSIGNSAFQNCTGLTSVIIPNSVTSIVDYAFDGCTGLTSVTIPNSVTSIRKDAFRDCTGFPVIDNIRYADTYLIEAVDKTLSTYTIKDGTKWIGSDAFEGCTGLTSIDIPNSVTSIGYSAFAYCTGLTSVTIPNSVTSIEGSAFEGCTGLTSVTIPNSVTSIGSWAFHRCTGLTSVTIPNSVTSIGSGAFYRVNNIVYTGSASSYYPWGAKSVNGYVEGYLVYKDATKTKLLGCSSAVNGEIVILNSVTSIGSAAFEGCTGLTSVTIPDSVTSIGKSAFYNCTGLTSVTIGNSVTSIGDCAFEGCTGLTSVVWNAKNCADFKGTSTPFYSFNDKFDLRSQITSFTFGDEVERIPRFLCSGMPNLTSVTIPNSVTSIGGGAFSNCGGLTSVTIPNSVTSIEDAAFSGCTGLTSVMIPSSVTGFGNSAFAYCSGLTSVTIPNSVTSIGEDAFRDCTGLTSVTCLAPTPPTCWSSKCFSGVDCSNIPLYVPMKSVSLYQAATIWKGFNVIGVMFADEVETAVFSATPTDDYGVILEWQAAENAILYNIDIIQGNDTIRKLQFDSNGKLLNSPSNAPSRYPNIHHASTAILSGNGWRYEVNDLDPGTNYTYSITVKAENGSVLYTQSIGFTTKEETFIIKFVNWNGEELLVLPEVVKGTTPSYTGETPVRPNTAEYTYTFVGWTPAIVAATSDTTYTATYTATKNSYTITWQNEDGSLIDQTTVEYGVVPTHAEPTKQATAEYTYTFSGWTPAVVAVTGDATYKATFTATKNSYTITWQNEDGSLIDQTTVEYGVVPTHTDPVKLNTAEYTYTFAGWTPAVVAVTGDATYKATFTATKNSYTITWQNEDGSLIDQTTVEYGVVPTHAEPTKEATEEYTYTFSGWTPAVVAVTGDATYKATFTATKNSYTITWQNEDGSLIDQTTVEYGVVPTHAEPTKEATEEYTYTFTGWTPAVVAVTGDATYKATFSSVVNVYTISVSAANGQVIGGGEYQYGATIDLTAIPDEGYVFDQWADGVTDNPRTITVTGDVEYTALFKSAEGFENIYTSEPVQKVMIDQKVYILRGDKTYTLQGQEVR